MELRARAPPPRVGLTMRGYGQFCPVAVACEVFAEAGPRKWVQAFPGWLLLSGFAGVERPPRPLAI